MQSKEFMKFVTKATKRGRKCWKGWKIRLHDFFINGLNLKQAHFLKPLPGLLTITLISCINCCSIFCYFWRTDRLVLTWCFLVLLVRIPTIVQKPMRAAWTKHFSTNNTEHVMACFETSVPPFQSNCSHVVYRNVLENEINSYSPGVGRLEHPNRSRTEPDKNDDIRHFWRISEEKILQQC